jgi:propanol-preferring alcohol dehydrogenase
MTRGVGIDGGLAQFMTAPRHEIVALGTLDPVDVAPLTDAGVTSYRAVKSVLNRLVPGSNAVVIGLGGLGALTSTGRRAAIWSGPLPPIR